MNTSPPDNLTVLLSALLDGSITPQDHDALADRLRTDPAARAAYHDAVELQSLLRWQHSDRANAPIAIPDDTPRVAAVHRPHGTAKPFTIPNSYTYAAAALVAIATIIVGLYVFTNSVDPKPDDPPTQPGPAVATLIENTGDLRTPHGYPAEGDDYGRGEYSLSAGSAEFMLTNAVNVKLRGDTRMWMRNDMNVALTRGSARFVCPADAKGFTVHLPDDSKIIDLGTAFRVSIDDTGRASVVVTEGSVRIDHAAEISEIFEAGQRIVLTDAGFEEPGPLHQDPATRVAYVFDGLDGDRRIMNLAAPRRNTDAEPFDGVVTDGATWALGEGPNDSNPLDLDGKTGHVRLGDGSTNPLAGADDFTVMAHVFWRGGEHWQRIFDTGFDEQRNMFLSPYGSHANRIAFAITVGGGDEQQRVKSSKPMPLNKWAHVAVTRRGSVVTLYLDGEPVGVNENVTIPTADVLGPQTYIGRSIYQVDPYLNGRIDAFVLLDRALTEDEIRDHVAAVQSGKKDPSSPLKETLK